ncbi:trypsin-like peptidase domain-containing protein [Microbispora hainanensis]|uniref:trypsin-like peptidase domain-containing protein n=1 Tax=Microbispora hainanensis TaxID=568844 RepID=UPI0033D98E1A
MGDGVAAGQVAEIIVARHGEPGRRGSGYRVSSRAVLTAAHVVQDASAIRVRFDADLPGEWTAEATSWWADTESDLAVLSITPRGEDDEVAPARFGRIGGERAAVLAVRAVEFPRFKLRDDGELYRDSHQADGSTAVLSNRREGTLEVTVPPPERDPDPDASPWEGMSGAAVWVGDRIVGVVAQHHRTDGPGRLAAARLDRALDRSPELRALLGLPEVVPDVVPRSAAELVRTDYLMQVREMFAPDRLLDRAAELDELVRFCAGDRPYAWWQAGPWAGKTALMAWLVLHPPSGVDVVSFFVTARLPGQSDSEACLSALIEQLAALARGDPAAPPTAGARLGTMLRLLEETASRSREAGRRLLLVIDGLDEDTGTSMGPSIASLLPRRPPQGVRILVASRPHPSIPGDVASDHQLRTLRPRLLDQSEHARAVEHLATLELSRLPMREPLQHDVLGLITASGGGLTLDDLAHLTGREPYEIEQVLRVSFARSVLGRTGIPSAGYSDEPAYLFAHETLRLAAHKTLRLAAYRDRLHAWAAMYQNRSWPADTPHYLLRGYQHMLAEAGDLPRLVACGTDQDRHGRMRALTGGDALALSDVNLAQQHLLRQEVPDLTRLGLLAVEQDHLRARANSIPAELPAVWARIGQPDHAEGLVSGISDWGTRGDALCGLVAASTAVGDRERAARLADEVHALASLGQPYARLYTLSRLAAVVDRDRARLLVDEAEGLIGQITKADTRDWALAEIAAAVTSGGDHVQAERITGRIGDPRVRVEALTRLVRAAAADDRRRIARLADDAGRGIRQLTDPADRDLLSLRLVEAVAAAGDPDRAEAIAEEIDDPGRLARALAGLAATAGTGEPARAARLVARVDWLVERTALPGSRVDALIATIVAHPGGDVEPLIEEIGGDWTRLDELAEAAAARGDHDVAERAIRRIRDSVVRMWQLARLAETAATAGDRDRAARLAGEVEASWRQQIQPFRHAVRWVSLAEAAGIAGDPARAAGLLDKAEEVIEQIDDPGGRWLTLAELMRTAADPAVIGRLIDMAEPLIPHISISWPAESLSELAEAAAAAGDGARAARLAAAAEPLIERIVLPEVMAKIMARLVTVAAALGDPALTAQLIDETEAIIATIPFPEPRERALSIVAGAVAAGGDWAWAETLTSRITDLAVRVERLAALLDAGHDTARPEAEALAGRIADPADRAHATIRLAAAVAATGDRDGAALLADRAETAARQIIDPYSQTSTMARLAATVAAFGDRDRAMRLVDEVEAAAEQITEPPPASVGTDGMSMELVEALIRCGDYDRAERVSERINDPGWRMEALSGLLAADQSRAARLAGEAEGLLDWIDHPDTRMKPLARFVRAIGSMHDRDRTVRVVTAVEELIGEIDYAGARMKALARLVEAIPGDHTRVALLADQVEALIGQADDMDRAEALARLAKGLAAHGDRDRAARLITTALPYLRNAQDVGPDRRAELTARLAEAAAAMGDHDTARRLAEETEAITAQVTYSDDREEAVARLAGEVAATGDHDRAEALVRRMTNPEMKVGALARLIKATGDHARSARLADEAETLVMRATGAEPRGQDAVRTWKEAEARARGLTELVGAVAATDQARATRLATAALAVPNVLPETKGRLARTLVETGTLPSKAHHLLATILATGSWPAAVVPMAYVAPEAVTALADDVQARWAPALPAPRPKETTWLGRVVRRLKSSP